MITPTVTRVENKRRRWGRHAARWYMMRQLGGCQHVREFEYNLYQMTRSEAAQLIRWERILMRRSVDAQRQDMNDALQAAMERFLGE